MMELSIFHEKLNKVDGNAYVIEEEIHMPASGIYDEELQHDNIADNTLAVYTGPMLTGEQIQTYALSTPSAMPWKRIIRIQSDAPVVYITYETTGDTVEADDINRVQAAIVETQGGVNAEEARAISAEEEVTRNLQAEAERAAGEEQRLDGRIDIEVMRAQEAEEVLSLRLDAEVTRAETAEQVNADAIATETSRAAAAEKVLTDNLAAEVSRATAAEKVLTDNLDNEIERAGNAEQQISGDLAAEVSRAEEAERILSDNLSAETARATAAEKILTDNLAAETTRATAAEKKNADGLKTETSRAESAEASIRSTINTNKPIWDDKYTRNEVDNKFSTLETAIDWKEAVNTFADLTTTYPNPEDGWTVNVKDTDYTYRWSGTEWVAISANAIPKATQAVDGLLSKEDKACYDDAYGKRHTHSNKTVLDKVTQALLDAWNAAYSHISDTAKHITSAERGNWADAYNKRHDHANKAVLDKVTQALLDIWNTVPNKVDKVPGKGLSANDYTAADKSKLSGIAAGAEVNVQPDWNVTDSASDAYIKNKPSAMPASDVKAWAKAATKPAYAWSEIGSKPSSFTPSAHTHAKSQITDMPSSLSQFENDAGYITAADVDTSQNHTHANKSILDSITQAMLNTWNNVTNKVDKVAGKGLSTNDFTTTLLNKLNGIAEGANKYTHPSTHPASMITQDSSHRFITDFCKTIIDWNAATTNGFYMASGATNAPASGWFFGRVIAHNVNYLYQEVYQFTASTDAKAIPKYIRARMNGTWGVWTNVTVAIAVPPNAKFTDTIYSHPNSGVAAGTYRSVTVNAQGHVTSGTNPNTLAGYGITDAAAKNHNHDSAYLKKGTITWNDLKGGG